jgi:GntR family transcriptional regulator of arabinose operon
VEPKWPSFILSNEDKNIPIDKNYWCIVPRAAIASGQEVELVYQFFKNHSDITACFRMDLSMTKLTYNAMERLGKKVGEDIEIISFDSSGISNISYLSQNTEEIGIRTVPPT